MSFRSFYLQAAYARHRAQNNCDVVVHDDGTGETEEAVPGADQVRSEKGTTTADEVPEEGPPMIPNAAVRLVDSSPVAESAEFGISMNDTAHIMSILRDQLYSDKILAVLREYGSNAWDAHRDAGKHELPIKITMPTVTEPTLVIRDFGLGLSSDGVFRIYTQYGASTKRNSDNAVGMLGIGSKSGFAYSDSFTVTSYHGGMKRTYIAVLDASEKGLINLLHEEPCGEETGVEISIAVRQHDINEFENKAKALYKYFNPRPDINVELPKLPQTQINMKHGVIYERDDTSYHDRKWVAVMGCVSYNINLEQVSGIDATEEGGIAAFLSNISGALYFNIGEVQVSASREELKYSEETKLALVRKFTALVDEYVKTSLDAILNGTFTPWERRVKAQVLQRLNLPVPADNKDLLATHISLKDKIPEGIIFTQNRDHVTSIPVDERTRFIIVDDVRPIRGFEGLSYKDYFVRAVTKDGKFRTSHVQWPLVEGKVTELINATGMQGLPVIRISSLQWHPPSRNSSGKKINPKHRMKLFKFNPSGGYSKPYSDAWEAIEHEPADDDVFVIIANFQTEDFDLGRYYHADKALAEQFGGTLPTIIGYKTSEKKPVSVKDCKGTHYPTWRDKFVPTLLTQQVKDQFALFQWLQAVQNLKDSWRYRNIDKRVYDKMTAELGPDHHITILVKNNYEGKAYFNKHDGLQHALQQLENRAPELKTDKSVAQKTLDLIYAKYPLLSLEGVSLGTVWSEQTDAWLQYIKLIDKG